LLPRFEAFLTSKSAILDRKPAFTTLLLIFCSVMNCLAVFKAILSDIMFFTVIYLPSCTASILSLAGVKYY